MAPYRADGRGRPWPIVPTKGFAAIMGRACSILRSTAHWALDDPRARPRGLLAGATGWRMAKVRMGPRAARGRSRPSAPIRRGSPTDFPAPPSRAATRGLRGGETSAAAQKRRGGRRHCRKHAESAVYRIPKDINTRPKGDKPFPGLRAESKLTSRPWRTLILIKSSLSL